MKSIVNLKFNPSKGSGKLIIGFKGPLNFDVPGKKKCRN